MSQEQPRRPQEESALKYGDVLHIGGDLAGEVVKPRDAAMMQSAENRVVGQTIPGGVAATMQAAAARNEQAGVVGHEDVTDKANRQGVTITETAIPGSRVYTEYVGEQIVGQYAIPTGDAAAAGGANAGGAGGSVDATDSALVTVGEALEAAARTAGDKPVDQKDAAAIQAAEARATGTNMNFRGGIAAEAQSAASANAWAVEDEGKFRLGEVLTNATAKMPGDKPVTREDAERVVMAEARNDPGFAPDPRGVAAAVSAAARLNQNAQA